MVVLFMRCDVITSTTEHLFDVAQPEAIGLMRVELHCWEVLEGIVPKPPAAVTVERRLTQGQHRSAAVPYVRQE